MLSFFARLLYSSMKKKKTKEREKKNELF